MCSRHFSPCMGSVKEGFPSLKKYRTEIETSSALIWLEASKQLKAPITLFTDACCKKFFLADKKRHRRKMQKHSWQLFQGCRKNTFRRCMCVNTKF